jgi:predicted nucleic acid binding AN1-type Zn finger protein
MITKPYAKIDWGKVDEMCKIQCTGEEIAGVLNIDYDTLNAGCKRERSMGFSDYFAQKAMGGKSSLRRAQFKAATEDGNSTMLIWLGKNMLNQTDKQEIDHNVNNISGIKLVSD